MNKIIDEYFELVQMENDFTKKYYSKKSEIEVVNIFNQIVNDSLIWKKIKSKEDIENILKTNKAMELMRIEDYYSDILCDLLEDYLKINFTEIDEEEIEKLLSKDSLQELLNKEGTPQNLKMCIDINLKCERICKELYIYIKENCQNTAYSTLEELDMKEYFGKIKKCAIFIHYSINDVKRIEEKTNRLKTFCENTLGTNNYEIFTEIGSFLEYRPIFESMLKRFEIKEFSHLIVTDIGQIYKLSYDMDKALELVDKIQNMNVTILSVDENRVVEGRETLEEEIESV